MPNHKVIGLTGPIGSGKNEVARLFAKAGATVIDVDQVAHELYRRDYPLWQRLVEKFGAVILKKGGEIDRQKLGAIVFADPRKLKQLNKLVHPALKKEIERRTRNVERGTRDVVINAALLKEIGLIPLVDEVWVVTASEKARLARLLKKGLLRKQASERMKAQPVAANFLRIADKIVDNNGTLQTLKKQISPFIRAS
ncbi:MAG: dephospho-CoA kinase [Candidatus Margulisiibacteriota bacterium]|jgi:dephospho-CoA kinase